MPDKLDPFKLCSKEGHNLLPLNTADTLYCCQSDRNDALGAVIAQVGDWALPLNDRTWLAMLTHALDNVN